MQALVTLNVLSVVMWAINALLARTDIGLWRKVKPVEPGAGEGTSGQGDRKPQNAPSPEVVSAEQQPGEEQADLIQGMAIFSTAASSEDFVGSGAVSTASLVPEVSESGQYEQASLEEVGSEQLVTKSQRNEDDGEMEYVCDSDGTSVAESVSCSGDLEMLNEINDFLDETFGKTLRNLLKLFQFFINLQASMY